MSFKVSGLVSLTALLCFGIFTPASKAGVLGEYTFENSSLAASNVASGNLDFSAFSADTGLKIPSSNPDGFAAGNGDPSDPNSGSGSAIIRSNWSSSSSYSPTNNQNFSFTVTPNGTDLNLSSLTFDARNSATGPSTAYVSTSVDNYATSTALTPSSNFSTLTTDLSNLTDITTPVTLKISGVGATNTGGTLRVDNVQLNGDIGGEVTPPPSPPQIPIYQAGSNIGQTVETKGIVTANFLGSNGLGGFFIQDTSSSNNPSASGLSNGIFVSAPKLSSNAISVGQQVDLIGQVSQTNSNGITKNQINLDTTPPTVISSGNTVAPTTVTLPVDNATSLQKYQGMVVSLPQTLSVTNNYPLGRYGGVGLSSGDPLYAPTQVAAPGDAAAAVATANSLNYIGLSSNSNKQNPDPIPYPPPGLSASNTLRVGDTTTGITGVVDSSSTLSGPSASSYVIDPTVSPTFNTNANPRPVGAPNVGGNIKVGDANVLNYFTTLKQDDPNARGAYNQQEFQRQQAKVVSNLYNLGADVIGLEEVENNGFGPNSALANLVNALNSKEGIPGLYNYIVVNAPATTGGDAITSAIIYKPSTVTPVGNVASLNTGTFDPSLKLTRPTLAQTFVSNSGGPDFTLVVNHWKSKGGTAATSPGCSSSANANGQQGGFNCTRTQQAKELATWLATNPTNSANPNNYLLVGDFNSYAQEDPITTLESSGYVNLDQKFAAPGSTAYSYQYGGSLGTLDYAFGSSTISPFVTGTQPLHINSVEPSVLDYGTAYKSPAQIDSLYAPDQYASSDHDPVLIGLNFSVPEPSDILGSLLGVGLFGFFKTKSRKK